MGNLPILPDDSEAAIERAREAVISTRNEKYPLLFENPLAIFASMMETIGRPPKVMPATLRVEIRDYTSALFDAEARTIIKHAESEELLRSWLNSVASRIQSGVTQVTTERSRLHDVHCPLHERTATIAGALLERTEHWIKVARSDPFATMARSRATGARLERTMAQAREQLAKLDAPMHFREKEVVQAEPKVGAVPQNSGTMAQFSKRAEWARMRLRERGWDHNDPGRFGGPDRKTVLKILAGGAAKEETLDKLVTALNRKKVGATIGLLDVPTN